MQSLVTLVLALMCSCLLLAQQFSRGAAYRIEEGKGGDIDRQLKISVLEEILEGLQGPEYKSAVREKRPIDGGYYGRYGVARNVGSKLMALKQAADWNGPGRRRRAAPAAAADDTY